MFVIEHVEMDSSVAIFTLFKDSLNTEQKSFMFVIYIHIWLVECADVSVYIAEKFSIIVDFASHHQL